MVQSTAVLEELKRVQRVAPLLNDQASREALKQYYRDLEASSATASAFWQISRSACEDDTATA